MLLVDRAQTVTPLEYAVDAIFAVRFLVGDVFVDALHFRLISIVKKALFVPVSIFLSNALKHYCIKNTFLEPYFALSVTYTATPILLRIVSQGYSLVNLVHVIISGLSIYFKIRHDFAKAHNERHGLQYELRDRAISLSACSVICGHASATALAFLLVKIWHTFVQKS